MTLRPEPYEELATEETFRALDAFAGAAAERGVEPAALAIAWVLSDPQVTAVVVGPRRPEHLEPALAALELRLEPAERDELAELFS
jgi:aryl-alcohol dehydrogenase-like predicted oxidoreductase